MIKSWLGQTTILNHLQVKIKSQAKVYCQMTELMAGTVKWQSQDYKHLDVKIKS